MRTSVGVPPPEAGRRPGPVSLDDVYVEATPDGPSRALMSGIQAIVRVIIDQRRLDRQRGLDTGAFVSGYEGSPLGGLDLELGRASAHLDAAGVVFRPGLNEELAATAVAGTQLLDEVPGHRHQGVTGWWYGKNPGLDRAADAIRHGNYAGTAPLGGVVALIGDDPACKSSTLPSSSWAMAKSLSLPLLAPGTVADVVRLGLHAVALSRATGVWAGLQIVTDVADGSAVVDLSMAEPVASVVTARPPKARLLVGPTALEAETDLFSVRLPAVLDYARAAGLTTVVADAPNPAWPWWRPAPPSPPSAEPSRTSGSTVPRRPRPTSGCVSSASTFRGRSTVTSWPGSPPGSTRCWWSRTRRPSSSHS